MKKRSEIEDKYKWDLSCYVKNEEQLKQNIKYLKDNIEQFKAFYNKFTDKAELKKYLDLSEEFDKVFDVTSAYLYHSLDTDTSNTKFLDYIQEISYISKDFGEATAYVYPQLQELSDEYLQELINDVNFKDYDLMFKEILRDKPHKVSEYDTQFLSKMSLFLNKYSDVFDTLTTGEIQFKNAVGEDGKTYEVSEADYNKLLNNKDRKVRETAFKSLMQGYGDKIRTLALIYTTDIQADIFQIKLAKFNSVRQSSMFYEEVDEKVYDTLIKNITSRVSYLHKIVDLKAKYFNLPDIAYYDIMQTFGGNKPYSIQDAVELVKKCTACLGDDYAKILNEKFEQKVIDYLPNENKETGAYSSGVYGCPSIVLMNFADNYNSVSTLAHEIGHAMHTEFSNRNQPITKANYAIFVAEVASTVNEVLLNLYVGKNGNETEKIALDLELLDSVRSTIFRQTMFSQFEDYAHTQLENSKVVNYNDFCNKYYELNKFYYGEKINLPEELKFEWSRIPHFYRPFYVYKYATGLVSALCIVQNLLTDKEYYKKYINFLKSGCTKNPVELLKDIDVDLTTDLPYIKAFEFVDNIIKELDK